jgi:threonine dehydrogenase-like Zn-dependent dehydrogenase
MRQLTYIKKNTLEWWDIKEPKMETAQDVIVRPLAAARCDGDKAFLFYDITPMLQAGLALHYIDPIAKDLFGRKPFKAPFAIGHECIAEILSCGDDVKHFKVGDKVIVPWAISCGSCSHCLSGLTSKCLDAGETLISGFGFGESLGPWGGMVTDQFKVPYADKMLVKIPNGLDPVSLASASDNIPDGWRTVAPYLKEKPGAPVLIVGGAAESIGLYAAGIAVALGSSKVDYLDYMPARLEIAKSLGANPIEMPKKSRSKWFRNNAPKISGAYPITVDASMNQDGIRFAIRSLAAGGICTSVGYYFQKGTSIPLMQMYANDSTLHTGISHPRASLPDVLGLIESKKFQPEKITTLLASWEDAAEAFFERTTKVIVHRPSIFTDHHDL